MQWDKERVYQYKNSDTLCCELQMTYDKTTCSIYYQGPRKYVVFQTDEELINSTERTRAAAFQHY
jgi:hypothetical protein